MELQTIFLIASSAISFIGIVYSVLATIFKAKGTKSVKLAKILQTLPKLINSAEEIFGSGNGVAKLNYVLNEIHIQCVESSLEFNAEEWTYEIETILETPQKKED